MVPGTFFMSIIYFRVYALKAFTMVNVEDESKGYLELREDAAGFAHIAYYSTFELNSEPTWLTHGPFEVTEIVSVDAQKQIVYFMSTEIESTQRHLYSVPLAGWLTGKSKLSDITVDQKAIPPHVKIVGGILVADTTILNAGYYTASFSPLSGYYLLSYMGPGIPFQKIIKSDTQGKTIQE